jgi:hypothetical protein
VTCHSKTEVVLSQFDRQWLLHEDSLQEFNFDRPAVLATLSHVPVDVVQSSTLGMPNVVRCYLANKRTKLLPHTQICDPGRNSISC